MQHLVLALVLTAMVACQLRVLSTVLRPWHRAGTRHPARLTGVVAMAIPVVVVMLLAARSWVLALESGSPALAVVMRADDPLTDRVASGPPVSPVRLTAD